MRTFIWKGALLLFFLVAVVAAAQEPKGPRMEVKQEHYSMGAVKQGAQAVHVFEVRSAGSEPLIIESLKPS
jgi:hypothetical protein